MKSTNAQANRPSRITLLVKLLLGALLVFYVVKGRLVDFEKLGAVLLSPTNLLISFGFIGFSVVCCAIRWYLLVRAQGLSVSLFNLFELTMIGNFFNSFMPGAVGGDLIKGWYIAGREPNAKTRAVFTVLLDRAIGMSVIVFYAAVTLLFFPQWATRNAQLKATAYSLWLFTAAAIIFGTGFFLSRFWTPSAVSKTSSWLRRWKMVDKFIGAGTLYRHHFVSVSCSVLLSVVSVLGLNLYYRLMGNTLGIPMTLAQYFFIVPVALVVSALPLLPGGIGVGQVAFFTLFAWMGIERPEQGGTLCTLVQIYTLLFNFLGIFFYLRFKRKPHGLLSTNASNSETSQKESAMIGVPTSA